MVLYGISGQTYKTQSAYTTTIFNYCGSWLRVVKWYYLYITKKEERINTMPKVPAPLKKT